MKKQILKPQPGSHTIALILGFCFVFLSQPYAQSCYIRLSDVSGITPTQKQLDSLEYAACQLRASLPDTFQNDFHVYDFGFYLHNENMVGGYPEAFQVAINQAQLDSKYYLIFGKQTDSKGVYTKFWVDLKLPTTGKFECIDLLSLTLRGDIKKKIEYVTTTTYAIDGGRYLQYARAEKAAMEALQKIVADFVDCCDLQARSSKPISACNSFLFPASLTEVTFSGDNYIEMKQDGDTTFGKSFPKPHYLNTRPDNGQSPIANVSGMNVSALAKFSGNDKYATIKVRGNGKTEVGGVTISLNFDERPATQNTSTNEITANMTGTLPFMIVFMDNFKIKWEMKVQKAGEPESDWSPAGESINDWYLTLRKPIVEDSGIGYLHFHSLFDISCRYGLGTSDVELINGVWKHFVNRQVKRADGQVMKYYGQWSGGNLAAKTSELLMYKDGECTAWVRLFLDLLKVHGFNENDNIVTVKATRSSGFFIKEWQIISNQGSYPNTEYPFKNIRGISPYNSNNTYNWDYAEVTLKKSPKSQNNNNPRSDFDRHKIAQVRGILYDPSYGIIYGAPKSISIPSIQYPGLFDNFQEVTSLDKLISAFYSQYPSNLLKIKMNIQNDNTTIVIEEIYDESNNY